MTTRTRQQERPQETQTPKRTISSVEAVALTESEKTNLSRETILGWYRAQRFEKLRALVDSSASEKREMKENVLKKTTDELVNLNKDLAVEERKKIAEKFAEKLFKAESPAEFERIISKLNQEATEEQMFFVYLGTYGGLGGVSNLKKLKEKQELAAIFQQNPELEKKFDEAAETGDIEQLRELLVKEVPAFKDLSQEEVDLMLILCSDSQGPFTEILNKIPVVGTAVKQMMDWIKRGEDLINYRLFKQVAAKLDVGTANLMNISHISLLELQHRNKVFQEHRHLLVSIIEKTENQRHKKKLEKNLKYIDDVKKIYEAVNDAMKDPETFNMIRQGLRKRLDQEKELTEADKDKILAEFEGYALESQGEQASKDPKAKFMSLNVFSFLPLVLYGPKGERNNDSFLYWSGLLAARYKRLKRAVLVRSATYTNIMRGAGMGRFSDAWDRLTGQNYRSTLQGINTPKGFDSALNEIDGRNPNFINLEEGKIKRADFVRDMKFHDKVLRDFNVLSEQMSRWLNEQSRGILGVEEELKRAGIFDANKTIDVADLSDNTYKYLGIDKTKIDPSLMSSRVQDAYKKKLFDLHDLREAAQKRFAMTSRNICENVIAPFERNLQSLKGDDILKSMKKQLELQARYIVPGERMKYYGKMLALPTIAISMPLIDAIRGKARVRDVKWDVFDAGIGFVPIAGTINDFKIAFSGHTTSGRKISFKEQLVAGGFGVLGAISDVAWVFGGLGAAMRAGIGGLRAGRAAAKSGRLGRNAANLMDVTRAPKSNKAFVRIAEWRGERAIRKVEKQTGNNYKKLIDNERSLKNSIEEAKNAKNAGNNTEILRLEKELDVVRGDLAPFLQAETQLATAGERLAQMGAGAKTAWRYAAIAGGAGGAYLLLGGVSQDAQKMSKDALDLAMSGAGMAYKAGKWTMDKALHVQYSPPEFEDIIDQFVKNRKTESDFNEQLKELERSDDPNKQEKIEDLCAENWTNPHVQAWVYQNDDKLDLKKIMERAREKLTAPMQRLHQQVGEDMPDHAGRREIARGDARSGSRSGETAE